VTLLYPDNVPNGAPAGSMDGFYGAAYAPVPHKALVRIDASRHFIMLDQPGAFDAALDAFLKS
jgi:pimeloyl-ACP methyl ester carboxylesterase